VARHSLPEPNPDGAPLVAGEGEVAVVAWGSSLGCCTIAGIDTRDGTLLWVREVDAHSTEPIVFDGKVVVGIGGRRGPRGRLVAFDAGTGTRRWVRRVRGPFEPGLRGDAADDLVVVPTRDGSIVAADVETGTLRWRSEALLGAAKANPQIASNQVFLTPDSINFVALDRVSGEVLSAGPIQRVVVVTDSDVLDGRLQLLVTNGLEAQVWTLATDKPRPQELQLH
jgi:outer membrane protein assembly factor BamB